MTKPKPTYLPPNSSITERLLCHCDEAYAAFQRKLCPTLDPQTILGVRTPTLRKLAKELRGTAQAKAFLQVLPHCYFEEDQLHAFLVAGERKFDRALAETECFLPYINNWATCDQFSPRAFAQQPERLLPRIDAWLESEHPYTVRYAIGMLMRYFLDDRFHPHYLEQVAAILREEYYIQMMVAWYFATALAKQYDATLPYLTEHRLTPWVHNKTISKARESFRVTDAHKDVLKALRH